MWLKWIICRVPDFLSKRVLFYSKAKQNLIFHKITLFGYALTGLMNAGQ